MRDHQRLFIIEATKYNVLPLGDRRVELANSDLAGRPTLIRGNSRILLGSVGRLHAVLNLKNKSFSVTAQIVVPKDGAELIAQPSKSGSFRPG